MCTHPTEILMIIFEYACTDGFGDTARQLGLVSKRFRAIVEPIELRTVTAYGLEQLQRVLARLEQVNAMESLNGRDGIGFDVRHLFISEVTKEHALAADTDSSDNSFSRRSFWLTEEGSKAEAFYHEHSAEFWRLATALLRSTGPKLRSLSMLSSDNWFSSHSTVPQDNTSAKVLGALSGVAFPKLRYLTVNHKATTELSFLDKHNHSFRRPALPALQKLRIISPVLMDDGSYRGSSYNRPPRSVHPLLKDVISRCPLLTHVVICDDLFRSAADALRAVFGEDFETILDDGILPGNLEHVSFQQGAISSFSTGFVFASYRERVHTFVRTIERLSVDGLEAHLPTPMFPGTGKREFELLVTEWKERCLSDPE